MAELTISPDEIRSALDEFVSSYQPAAASMTEVGVVVTSGDGIARVEGLPSAMANELLRFENGTMGIALNLDEREIGVVVLGDSEGIDEGSTVHGTGEVLSVPVGASSTRWAIPSTGSVRSGTSRAGAPWNSRRPVSWTVRRSANPCRPASRPSTR